MRTLEIYPHDPLCPAGTSAARCECPLIQAVQERERERYSDWLSPGEVADQLRNYRAGPRRRVSALVVLHRDDDDVITYSIDEQGDDVEVSMPVLLDLFRRAGIEECKP